MKSVVMLVSKRSESIRLSQEFAYLSSLDLPVVGYESKYFNEAFIQLLEGKIPAKGCVLHDKSDGILVVIMCPPAILTGVPHFQGDNISLSDHSESDNGKIMEWKTTYIPAKGSRTSA